MAPIINKDLLGQQVAIVEMVKRLPDFVVLAALAELPPLEQYKLHMFLNVAEVEHNEREGKL